MLNELKSQIELINNIDEINKIKNKLKVVNYLINEIIKENEKNKVEIQILMILIFQIVIQYILVLNA